MAEETSLRQKCLFASLIASAIDSVISNSSARIVAVASKSMLRLYRRMGIQAKVLGNPATVCGDERWPVEIDLHQSAFGIATRLQQQSFPTG